ncbi:sesquipedalian-1 isoform X1 [Solea solea]|uniref:sesquipedalian-1 isoform X1 n=2 Tax=Solea solea TaxID=90069 RepID=UPI00272D1850|nr:sesquipedalian-1 isoform X1 [Solea solea]
MLVINKLFCFHILSDNNVKGLLLSGKNFFHDTFFFVSDKGEANFNDLYSNQFAAVGPDQGGGMKLHKKILTHYLSCTSPVDKEGYLYKKRERNGTYQRRWFVLKANLLFYQERPADRHLLGVIVLEGCAVRSSQCEDEFAFSLVFEGPGLKTYTFAAVDCQTRESWVKALLSASHCYLSLLVRDLGRQYEEAKQLPRSGESHLSSSVSLLKPSPACSFFSGHGPTAVVRQGRSFSASSVLQAPSMSSRVAAKKSPKLWHRRNALVTPLNGPAPYGEWPLVGLDLFEDFSKLHDYYGQEVRRAKGEWLRSRRTAEDGDLIDLG